MLTEDESRHALELDDSYLIYPEFPSWRSQPFTGGTTVPEGFRYSSDLNPEWLSSDDLRAMLPSLQTIT